MNNNIDLDALVKAGNIHKNIKQQILPMIRPGVKLYDISRRIASLTRELSQQEINGGMPFSPSVSVNHIVCHHSPLNNNDKFNNNDNVKIDFGYILMAG